MNQIDKVSRCTAILIIYVRDRRVKEKEKAEMKYTHCNSIKQIKYHPPLPEMTENVVVMQNGMADKI